ncbi:hypothetical protein F4861DRAFT_267209 [Xylaria intraflava]|nr:hypothetical protein F4861DRAFT_267209 [Xylaria intraflava]
MNGLQLALLLRTCLKTVSHMRATPVLTMDEPVALETPPIGKDLTEQSLELLIAYLGTYHHFPIYLLPRSSQRGGPGRRSGAAGRNLPRNVAPSSPRIITNGPDVTARISASKACWVFSWLPSAKISAGCSIDESCHDRLPTYLVCMQRKEQGRR